MNLAIISARKVAENKKTDNLTTIPSVENCRHLFENSSIKYQTGAPKTFEKTKQTISSCKLNLLQPPFATVNENEIIVDARFSKIHDLRYVIQSSLKATIFSNKYLFQFFLIVFL